jgi:putative ABC transport system permease protein
MNNFKLAVRGVFRNKRRTLIAVGAIAVALTCIIVLDSFMDGADKQLKDNVIESSGHLQLYAPGYYDEWRTLPTDIAIGDLAENLERIREMDGVVDATARITFGGLILHEDDEIAGIITGIETDAAARMHNYADKVQEGRYITPDDSDACVVGYRMADLLKIEVGDTITAVTQTSYGALTAMDFNVVGTVATLNPMIDEGGVLIRLEDAQRHVELEDAATAIVVNGEDPDKSLEFKDDLLALLNAGVELETPAAVEETVAVEPGEEIPLFAEEAPTGGFEEPDEEVEAPTREGFEGYTWFELNHLIFDIMGMKDQIMDIIRAVMIIMAAAMIANTMLTNVFERTREIGVLMALGAKGRQILALFLGEALTLGIIGSVFGVILGAGLGLVFQYVGIDFGGDFTEWVDIPMGSVFYGLVTPLMLVHAFILGVVVSVLAGIYPALKAARMLPTEALRFI